MTLTQKNELISKITTMLDECINVEPAKPEIQAMPTPEQPLEMLTVKECADLVSGITEHTVRQLIAHNKVIHVRAGAGRNGKILVSKASLLRFLGIEV
ncbi:DNA-binding protein [Ruminococcus sp.]|uniref:DNA-binding protein n=1 Tax=Ruminococcus sp. TaxID=41978 RepID=UPI002589BE93|nr:DNA-binding protein [Ruminococcus sp.]MCR5021145.1 DNA-binding protein [Ruminococcus sp.]